MSGAVRRQSARRCGLITFGGPSSSTMITPVAYSRLYTGERATVSGSLSRLDSMQQRVVGPEKSRDQAAVI
jgi:hypothetical protein